MVAVCDVRPLNLGPAGWSGSVGTRDLDTGGTKLGAVNNSPAFARAADQARDSGMYKGVAVKQPSDTGRATRSKGAVIKTFDSR